jgi:hypothetical protein
MCCQSTADRVVSHHLAGSGSSFVRGILHPNRTGFASFSVHQLDSRRADSTSTTEEPVAGLSAHSGFSESCDSPHLAVRPLCVPSRPTRIPKNTALSGPMDAAPLVEPAVATLRGLRDSCVAAVPDARAPFEEHHSRSASPASLRHFAPSSFSTAASEYRNTPPSEARPRGVAPNKRPDSGLTLPQADPNLLLPWASDFPSKVRHPNPEAEASKNRPKIALRLP